MLTTRGILKFLRQSKSRPLSLREISNAMNLKNSEKRKLRGLLRGLEKSGQVYQTKGNKYILPGKLGLITGRLQGHAKGYGFVIPEKPGIADLYVGRDHLNGAMHNDKVFARVTARGGNGKGAEGEIVKIVKRANRRVIGTFHRLHRAAYVVPDEVRIADEIAVSKGRYNDAAGGDKVVVEITSWPGKGHGSTGRIVEVLGPAGAPGVQSRALCIKYDLEEEFPTEVLAEARALTEIPAAEIKNRKDLRQLCMVTIDGADAKDLDDAVSLEMLDGGIYRLGVHIADVSHYVREGGCLDEEARKRGTSVYLVDRVLPMLPPELSNDICSLNPGVDRLAMSVIMDVDSAGEVTNYDIAPSVININERMTYDALRMILVDQDREASQRYEEYLNMFRKMEDLCLVFQRRRAERGAVDFNIPEIKIELDESGKPINISRRERTIAEQIIEEFMLATNETIAQHFYHLDIPFLYRIHEEPDEDKIKALNEFLYNFRCRISSTREGIHPSAVQEVLNAVKGIPEERLINTVVLRSMQKAAYSHENLGHFGLAAQYYTHFTAPIRRYSDLMIHRIIHEILAKGVLSEDRTEQLKENLPQVAEHCSKMERVAMEAERESVDIKAAEYMHTQLGEVFPGVISGITSFGIFVELENLIEGFIHLSTVTDDYYVYNEKTYTMIGQRTKRSLRIGDAVSVRVVRVNVEQHMIDFELVE
ncbi:MAG TPA: ribonuclease R [Clostridia bacterium]|nr:ribonuclease R [Clostridia bacterium]